MSIISNLLRLAPSQRPVDLPLCSVTHPLPLMILVKANVTRVYHPLPFSSPRRNSGTLEWDEAKSPDAGHRRLDKGEVIRFNVASRNSLLPLLEKECLARHTKEMPTSLLRSKRRVRQRRRMVPHR